MGNAIITLSILVLSIFLGVGNYPSLKSFDEKIDYYNQYVEIYSSYEGDFVEWINDFYSGNLGTYTVTFESDYSFVHPDKVFVNKYYKMEEPMVPFRRNYYFLGWYNGDEKWDFNNYVTSDMILTAKWSSLYDLGIASVEKKTSTYEVYVRSNFEEIDLEAITNSNYEDEIYKNKNGKKLKSTIVSLKPGVNEFQYEYKDESKKYTYQIKIIKLEKVTVSFNTNGIVEISPITINGGDYLENLPLIEKDGYYFGGWDYELNTPIIEDTVINANIMSYSEVVDKVKASIGIKSGRYHSSFELPMSSKEYPEATIKWDYENFETDGTGIYIEEGMMDSTCRIIQKLSTRDENGKEVVYYSKSKLYVTISFRNISKTYEFDIEVESDFISINDVTIAEIKSTSIYYLNRTITFDPNQTYDCYLEGTVIHVGPKGFYLYDGTAAIYVFSSNDDVSVGDHIKIRGARLIYYNMPQIKDVKSKDIYENSNIDYDNISEKWEIDDLINESSDISNYEHFGRVVNVSGRLEVLENSVNNYTIYLHDDESNTKIEIESRLTLSDQGLKELLENDGQYVTINSLVYQYRTDYQEWQLTYITGTIK